MGSLQHIARFCKKNKNHTENPQQAAGSCDSVNLPSFCRIMIDIEILGTLVSFLYDPGSQYSMITRNVYDSLSTKPPLNLISKSGIGVDGNPFEIDGVTYINLTMKTENKEIFVIEYEPVIVTSKFDMCIFGIKSEEKFKECVCNESNHTLEYHTENDRTVSVKFYRESGN